MRNLAACLVVATLFGCGRAASSTKTSATSGSSGSSSAASGTGGAGGAANGSSSAAVSGAGGAGGAGGARDGGGTGGTGGSTPDPDPPHLPFNPAGWTEFPTNYAVTIYVDSVTGSDKNPGTSPTAPIQSLAQVSTVISARTVGQSMRVELKRGSSWPGQRLTFSQGGDSAAYPLLIEGWSYGDSSAARPAIGSILMWHPGSVGLDHIAIVGIYFGPGGGADTGINYSPGTTGGQDLLLEDDVVDGFFQNIIVQGTSSVAPLSDFKMRRCQTINAYDVSYDTVMESKPQGVYAYALQSALFEENVFDHNAYHYDDLRDATEFGHDLYISNATGGFSFDVELRGNLISRGLHSIKGPATGTIDNNILYADGFGGYMGSQGGSFTSNVVYDNTPKQVFGYDIATSKPTITQQGGFSLDGDMSAGAANGVTTVHGNLFGNGASAAFSLASGVDAKLAFSSNVIAGWQQCIGSYDSSTLQITGNQCQGGAGFTDAYALHTFVAANSTLSDNTYYWPAGASAADFQINGTALTFAAFAAQAGESGSKFAQVPYPDPSVDLAPYLAQLPGAPYGTSPTVADFITAIEQQSRYNWMQDLRVPVVANYLRAGYALPAVAVPYASGI